MEEVNEPQKLISRIRSIKAILHDYIYQFLGNLPQIETNLEHIHGRKHHFDQLLMKVLKTIFSSIWSSQSSASFEGNE